jgi:hypothetical protein
MAVFLKARRGFVNFFGSERRARRREGAKTAAKEIKDQFLLRDWLRAVASSRSPFLCIIPTVHS